MNKIKKESLLLEPKMFKLKSPISIHEARGWIIDRFLQVELRINNSIIDFFKPENEDIFRKTVLNNSVISIGGKLKILTNMGKYDGKLVEMIRQMDSIRNGFAHAQILEQLNIVMGERILNNAESKIEVMNADGKFSSKNAGDLLEKFIDLSDKVKVLLK